MTPKEMAILAAKALDGKKGEEIKIMEVTELTTLADYFVICTGSSNTQINALCDAVEELCGVRPGLKWPNDPVLCGKKLCGILTEMSLEAETGRVQSLVLGIGINVGQQPEDFSPEVREVATSLLQVLGRPVSRPQLTAALLEELDRAYSALLAGDLSEYQAAYRRDCVNLGKTVQLLPFGGGERETAQAVDIDEEFSLVVRGADGKERTVRSGEVSVRGLWGYTE